MKTVDDLRDYLINYISSHKENLEVMVDIGDRIFLKCKERECPVRVLMLLEKLYLHCDGFTLHYDEDEFSDECQLEHAYNEESPCFERFEIIGDYLILHLAKREV